MGVFNIIVKNFTTIELDFEIPSWPGFTHIKNELFLAGGQDQNPINDFRRISASEKVVKLQPLPTGKWFFPMPSWERQENVITLGGAVGGMNHLD